MNHSRRSRLLCVVLSIGALSASCSHAQPAGRAASETQEGKPTMANGTLRLSPTDFWDDPLKTRDEFESTLLGQDREAILIDAPAQVTLGARETLPIVILRTVSNANELIRPFRRAAIITAVRLDENAGYAGPAISPSPRPSAPPKSPEEPAPEGMTGEAFAVDARTQLGLPWRPSRLILTLLIADQVSQRVAVELVDPPDKFQDPEAVKAAALERLKTNIPRVNPAPASGAPFPSYQRDSQSPAAPATKGIRLEAPRVVDPADPEACVLRGSFRLPILRRHVVPTTGPKTGAEEMLAQFKQGLPAPTGVVPIMLVATGSKAPTPFTWTLIVPTYDPIPAGPNPTVTGTFAIDLQQLGNVKGIEQTLWVYAFSDEAMAGPVAIAMVKKPGNR